MKFNRLVGFLRDTLPLPCHSSTWHHYLSTLQNIEIEFFFFNSFLLVCLNYLTRGFFLFFFLKKKNRFYVSKTLLKKLKFFFLCFKLIFFSVFKSFWCANIKNNLKKNSILMHFQVKSTLKCNRNHTPKRAKYW
jgi:hypothetical protein